MTLPASSGRGGGRNEQLSCPVIFREIYPKRKDDQHDEGKDEGFQVSGEGFVHYST